MRASIHGNSPAHAAGYAHQPFKAGKPVYSAKTQQPRHRNARSRTHQNLALVLAHNDRAVIEKRADQNQRQFAVLRKNIAAIAQNQWRAA